MKKLHENMTVHILPAGMDMQEKLLTCYNKNFRYF